MTRVTLYKQACVLYDALEAEAENGMFSGKKTDVFRNSGIPQGKYTKLFSLLTETGCIEQIRRGDTSVSTLIRLHHPPDQEAIDSAYIPLTKPRKSDSLRQRVEVLERRLPDIDLDAYFKSLESRLADIEDRIERNVGP